MGVAIHVVGRLVIGVEPQLSGVAVGVVIHWLTFRPRFGSPKSPMHRVAAYLVAEFPGIGR